MIYLIDFLIIILALNNLLLWNVFICDQYGYPNDDFINLPKGLHFSTKPCDKCLKGTVQFVNAVVFQETVTFCRENELIPGKSKLDDIDEPRDDTEKTLCVV